MAEMKTERKSVFEYLSKNKFLIPIYQRKYTWGIDECEQLWDDVMMFFENKDEDEEEYFLGSIVMYKDKGRQNIIDGQQRTTTLSLLIRVLYEKAKNHKDEHILVNSLSNCLWEVDQRNGKIDFDKKHLISEVAIDGDNEILESILSDKPLDMPPPQQK